MSRMLLLRSFTPGNAITDERGGHQEGTSTWISGREAGSTTRDAIDVINDIVSTHMTIPEEQRFIIPWQSWDDIREDILTSTDPHIRDLGPWITSIYNTTGNVMYEFFPSE